MKKRFTTAERAQIAVGFKTSGMNQVAYAAQVGVCPRSLRNFLRRHEPSPATGIAVEKTVQRAVKALRAAADTLEASIAAATPSATTPLLQDTSVANAQVEPATPAQAPTTLALPTGMKFDFD